MGEADNYLAGRRVLGQPQRMATSAALAWVELSTGACHGDERQPKARCSTRSRASTRRRFSSPSTHPASRTRSASGSKRSASTRSRRDRAGSSRRITPESRFSGSGSSLPLQGIRLCRLTTPRSSRRRRCSAISKRRRRSSLAHIRAAAAARRRGSSGDRPGELAKPGDRSHGPLVAEPRVRCSPPSTAPARRMGGRLLRQWLRYPLCDLEHIQARQSAIAALLASPAELRGDRRGAGRRLRHRADHRAHRGRPRQSARSGGAGQMPRIAAEAVRSARIAAQDASEVAPELISIAGVLHRAGEISRQRDPARPRAASARRAA